MCSTLRLGEPRHEKTKNVFLNRSDINRSV